MTTLETVALYYDAWKNKEGDLSDVPLTAAELLEVDDGVIVRGELI